MAYFYAAENYKQTAFRASPVAGSTQLSIIPKTADKYQTGRRSNQLHRSQSRLMKSTWLHHANSYHHPTKQAGGGQTVAKLGYPKQNRPSIKKSGPLSPPAPKYSVNFVKWLQCAMFVLVTSLCLAFSDDDLTFFMTSAYSQYLEVSVNQHFDTR